MLKNKKKAKKQFDEQEGSGFEVGSDLGPEVGSEVGSEPGSEPGFVELFRGASPFSMPSVTGASFSDSGSTTEWESMDRLSATSSFSSWESRTASSRPYPPKPCVTNTESLEEGATWLRVWLQSEAKLRDRTLSFVHEAFLYEDMDSKLGLEYLNTITLAEFKAELAEMGVTKKGVVSKLRGAVRRLFA